MPHLHRRTVLATGLAALLAPMARASETLDYSDGLIETALANGETVFVEYGAKWCSTCARQQRVIGALRAANPAYDAAMMFVRVDWDAFRREEVTTSRNIPRRSTLVLLRGEGELGRLVASTREADIKALLDLGLVPAT